MLFHLVLPLECESGWTDDHDSLRRLAAHEAGDEQTGFDGFAEAHIIREDVPKTIP